MITATKLKALARKHQPSPMLATSNPPIPGPMVRALLIIDELSVTALIKSSLVTNSVTNAWRTGKSNALNTPSKAAMVKTCQTCTRPVSVIAASTKQSSIGAICVASSMLRRDLVSATTPLIGARTKMEICPEKATNPNNAAEPVSRYTNQAWATV